MGTFHSTEFPPVRRMARLRRRIARALPGACRLHLCVELTQAGAAGLDQPAVLGGDHDRDGLEHQYLFHCQGVHRTDCQLLPAGKFPWEYRVPARVAKAAGSRLKVATSGQEHLFDRHGYAPGVYDFDVQGELAISKWLHAHAQLQGYPAPEMSAHRVEDAEPSPKQGKAQRHPFRPAHKRLPQVEGQRTRAAVGEGDEDTYVPGHCMHGRIVARSPLGEPSEAAKRFLEQPDRYDNYVEPDPAIAKAGALAEAQREARTFRGGPDQTPGRRIARRAGDVEPNGLRLLAMDVELLASRVRAARALDQALSLESVAADLREQAKAIELLALNMADSLERAA